MNGLCSSAWQRRGRRAQGVGIARRVLGGVQASYSRTAARNSYAPVNANYWAWRIVRAVWLPTSPRGCARRLYWGGPFGTFDANGTGREFNLRGVEEGL